MFELVFLLFFFIFFVRTKNNIYRNKKFIYSEHLRYNIYLEVKPKFVIQVGLGTKRKVDPYNKKDFL